MLKKTALFWKDGFPNPKHTFFTAFFATVEKSLYARLENMNLGQIKIGEYQATAVLYINKKQFEQETKNQWQWQIENEDMNQKIHCLPNLPDSIRSILCRCEYAIATQQKKGKAPLCGLFMAQEVESIFNMFSTFLKIIFATIHL